MAIGGGYSEVLDLTTGVELVSGTADDVIDDHAGGTSASGLSTEALHSQSATKITASDPKWEGAATQIRKSTYGGTHTFGCVNSARPLSTVDYTGEGRLVIIHTRPANVTFYSYINGSNSYLETPANNGVSLTLFSGSSYANHIRYGIGGYGVPLKGTTYQTWHPTIIEAGNATDATAVETGTFDETDIQDAAIHSVCGGQAVPTVYFWGFGYLDPWAITGTGETITTLTTHIDDTEGIVGYLSEAVGLYLFLNSITLGDGGTTTTSFSLDGDAIAFPSANTSTFKRAFISDNVVGWREKAGANDTRTINSVTFTNPNLSRKFPFILAYTDASAYVGAGLGYTNCTVNGAGTITIDEEFTLTSTTFSNCDVVDASDGAPELLGTTKIISPNGDGIQINGFDNCGPLNFQGVSASNSCIVIGDNTTRTESPSAITTDSSEQYVIEYTGTGTLTINQPDTGVTLISSGGSPNCIATGGGSIVITSTASWTLEHTDGTELPDGTRIRIVDSVDGEIYNTTVSGSSGFSIADSSLIAGRSLTLYATYQSGTTVRQGGPWPLIVPSGGGTMSWTANTTTVDSVYSTYSIDGSTVTEFSTDYINVQCDIDDVDGETTHKRAYAWMRYIQTTEQGIRNWWGLVTAQDAANIVYNGDVVDLQFNNDNAATANLLFTDEDIYVAKSGGAANLWGEGITAFAGKVYLAETGVSGLTSGEANQLASIATVESKIDTLDTVADSIAATTVTLDTKVDVLDTVADAINVKIDTLDTVADAIKVTTDSLDTKVDAVDAVADSIKAKTDSLTFTESGNVDANIQYVNDVAVTGTGAEGDTWGPA